MPVLSIDRRDLLHPADEPDVWINLVGTFRRLDGITAEVLLDDLVCATHGVGSWGDGWARITCVLDTTPARRVRRLAHAILVEHGARAEVEWSYELAPQPVAAGRRRPSQPLLERARHRADVSPGPSSRLTCVRCPNPGA